jgi:hypothetical protein
MRMGDSEWAQPVGELIQLSLSSDYFTEKLTNRPLPLSETMKAHKWAQPVILLFTPLYVYVSPQAALEGEAAGEAMGRSVRREQKARNADTAEQQRQPVNEEVTIAWRCLFVSDCRSPIHSTSESLNSAHLLLRPLLCPLLRPLQGRRRNGRIMSESERKCNLLHH